MRIERARTVGEKEPTARRGCRWKYISTVAMPRGLVFQDAFERHGWAGEAAPEMALNRVSQDRS